jgi:outer membrane protein assembly factor BamB
MADGGMLFEFILGISLASHAAPGFNILMPYRICLLAVMLALPALADEYPQWLGPQRDGVYRETGIVTTFPKAGPKVLWRAPVAAGYSQPAVAPGKVIVTDHVLKEGAKNPKNPFQRGSLPGNERVLCLDDADGHVLWKVEYDCPYTISYASGPRATPAIEGERVYTFGAEGDLYCIDLASGKVVWNKKLKGPAPIWGFSASPLIEGDNLIVLSSGHPVLTAFNKTTGEIAWTALESKEPGYSPPMIHTLGGRRELVQWYSEALAALDPKTGKPIWALPYGPARMGVSITTPLRIPNDTFILSTQYEGCAAIQIVNDEPKLLWHKASKGRAVTALHSLHSPLAYTHGQILGINNTGEMLSIDPADGHILWRTTEPTLGKSEPVQWTAAFITPWKPSPQEPAKQIFIANEKGDLIIAHVEDKGYHEIARAHLLEPTNADAQRLVVWSHPAYAHQSLYWRNDKELIRVSLADKAE